VVDISTGRIDRRRNLPGVVAEAVLRGEQQTPSIMSCIFLCPTRCTPSSGGILYLMEFAWSWKSMMADDCVAGQTRCMIALRSQAGARKDFG
jgi:hypothetical protein